MDAAMKRREPERQRDAKCVPADVHAELLSLLVRCQGNPEGSDCSSPLSVESMDFLVCVPCPDKGSPVLFLAACTSKLS